MGLIKLKELSERTGATYHQLNSWSKFVFFPENIPGNTRYYDENIVERVKVLVQISNGFGGYFSVDSLKKVYENFDRGYIDVNEGIKLSWETSHAGKKCSGRKAAGWGSAAVECIFLEGHDGPHSWVVYS